MHGLGISGELTKQQPLWVSKLRHSSSEIPSHLNLQHELVNLTRVHTHMHYTHTHNTTHANTHILSNKIHKAESIYSYKVPI